MASIAKKVIEDIVWWLHESEWEIMDIATVSARSGYSIYHLQRVFKIHTGYKLGCYILHVKLSRAADELKFTEESIANIAFKHGYVNQQSFTRSFTRFYFISPRRYRDLHKRNYLNEGV